MKSVKPFDYSSKIEKMFKKFNKDNKGIQNNIFKSSLINEERISNLSRLDNLLNGRFYYVFAPKLGLHTNSEIYYKDENGNWWCELGLALNPKSGLFTSVEGFLPMTDTIINMFK